MTFSSLILDHYHVDPTLLAHCTPNPHRHQEHLDGKVPSQKAIAGAIKCLFVLCNQNLVTEKCRYSRGEELYELRENVELPALKGITVLTVYTLLPPNLARRASRFLFINYIRSSLISESSYLASLVDPAMIALTYLTLLII
jgi:hypothetical protein